MSSHACCLKYITHNGHTGWHLFEEDAITRILQPSENGKCKCPRLNEILDFAYQVNFYEPYIATEDDTRKSEINFTAEAVQQTEQVGELA